MKFDKLSLFADGLTVPTTANNTTYSKVLDLRKCGQIGIDGFLRVWGGIVGTANTTGSVTTILQTSADATTWDDLVSETQNANSLIGLFVPCKGVKRFVRLAFVVGSTALGSAVTVKAGLVDQFDIEDLPTIQSFPPLEDLTALGDMIEKALVVAESAKSVTKGSNADVAVSGGYVVSSEAPTGYTLTVTQGTKVNIALAASAASGNVVLVDGLGVKHTIAVTAA